MHGVASMQSMRVASMQRMRVSPGRIGGRMLEMGLLKTTSLSTRSLDDSVL